MLDLVDYHGFVAEIGALPEDFLHHEAGILRAFLGGLDVRVVNLCVGFLTERYCLVFVSLKLNAL